MIGGVCDGGRGEETAAPGRGVFPAGAFTAGMGAHRECTLSGDMFRTELGCGAGSVSVRSMRHVGMMIGCCIC